MNPVNSLELKKYYSGNSILGKNILPSYSFFVDIIDSSIYVDGGINLFPKFQHFHVLNVNLPIAYDIKKETQKYGMMVRSFPFIDYDGLEFSIQFEEDQVGTITNFIQWLQRRMVTEDGLCQPPVNIRLKRFVITVENQFGVPVIMVFFNNVYFLRASTMNLNYAENGSVKYDVTFNADWMDVNFLLK